jgi:hypothetical protein
VVVFFFGVGEALGFILFFLVSQISHFCNLKNMILTHMKDFCKKMVLNSPDFENTKLPDLYNRFQQVANT